MTANIAPIIANTNSFGDWLFRTNEVIDFVSNSVPSTENILSGNVAIDGTFQANTLYTTTLYGGGISAPGPLEVAANTIFSANVSFTGNTVTMGVPSRYTISGANATHFLLAANTSTGRLRFVDGSVLSNIDASDIVSGTFDVARIPNLDAAKITTGTFDGARIPNLDAAKITTGTIADARLTGTYTGMIFQNDTGSANTPTYSFSSNTNMGMYRADSNTVAWTIGGTQRMTIDSSGNLTVTGDIDSFSDARLKSNITAIDNPLHIIKKLNGISFNWNKKSEFMQKQNTKDYGVLANEIEQVFPELVHSSNGYKTVSYSKLIPLLIECIKELKTEIDELKSAK